MAFQLGLPEPWASRGWKAKIRDRERMEPPHVSVIFKGSTWRLNLRTGHLLDKEPPPADLPTDLLAVVRSNIPLLIDEWDRMYPENPVISGKPTPRSGAKSRIARR